MDKIFKIPENAIKVLIDSDSRGTDYFNSSSISDDNKSNERKELEKNYRDTAPYKVILDNNSEEKVLREINFPSKTSQIKLLDFYRK